MKLKIIIACLIFSALNFFTGCNSQMDGQSAQGGGSSVTIAKIQGAGHVSSYNGQIVKDVRGIVTAIRNDGFYMQDAKPDNNPATSEALLVFTMSTPAVKIGDEVLVAGTVDEYYPGGITTTNLTITEIKNPVVKVLENGKILPDPIVIGAGGRTIPKQVIDDDQMSKFDPEQDGLDFFESMESMLVQVNNAVVVGPTNAYKEIVVLADDGAGAGARSYRGGIVIQANDYNPERIMIDDLLTILPDATVGDRFEKPLIGVVDYNFGSFRILPKQRPTLKLGGLAPETAPEVKSDEISISGFNVQNLDPSDGQKKFEELAKAIVNNLKSPDIISLEEVQDNNGMIDGVVVDASETYRLIIQAIKAAGGPAYQYVDIAPEANQDGGEPGGNIRVGFIYRTDRGISFTRIEGGSATQAVGVAMGAKGLELSANPGRIDPKNEAYLLSRKPLIAQFDVKGTRIFVIGLHLNSKGGDAALYGRFQPPTLPSEVQRLKQADSLNAFMSQMLKLDSNAKVVMLGDLNDFQFSAPVKTLLGNELINLVSTIPVEKQFSYIYEGNGQVLDHILVSKALQNKVTYFGFVHLNSEFAVARRLSDHDPALVKISVP